MALTNEQLFQLSQTDHHRALKEMATELLRWRQYHLDKPEDRLWHDSDGTWWKRDDTSYLGIGALISASPPTKISLPWGVRCSRREGAWLTHNTPMRFATEEEAMKVADDMDDADTWHWFAEKLP